MTEPQESQPERTCHYCELPIADNDRAIEAKTRNGWAHVTCWYDGGPFEREQAERAAALQAVLDEEKPDA